MSAESIVQTLLYGLLIGGIYGIAALGLALVFGVLKILNIAHGELIMLGGYVSFWALDSLRIDPFLSLVISIPALFLFGLLLDRLVYRHIVRMEGDHKIKNSLLVSFGLALVIQNLALWLFSADERALHVPYAAAGFSFMGVTLPITRLAGLLIAMAIAFSLHRFLHHTDFGQSILATAEDGEAAELAGIDIQRVHAVTMALGAALAAVAGMLVALTIGVAPGIGVAWTLKSLIVLVLAGTGSILGVFPAGLVLGLAEAAGGALFGASSRELMGLVVFLLVLIFRPRGLLGATR